VIPIDIRNHCRADFSGHSVIFLLILILSPTAYLLAQACPDKVAWTGKYRNYSYHFTITIPAGYKGYWNSAACVNGPDGCVCMSDHGPIIPLTPAPHEPERHIEISAGYATDDETTVAESLDNRLKWTGRASDKGTTEIRKRTTIQLAGSKGQRIAVRYHDAELNTWIIEDIVVLLRNGVEYSLALRTHEQNHQHDRPIFEHTLATFAFTLRGTRRSTFPFDRDSSQALNRARQ
jgi:hypothetical protein